MNYTYKICRFDRKVYATISHQPDVILIGNGTHELETEERAQLSPPELSDYNREIPAIAEG